MASSMLTPTAPEIQSDASDVRRDGRTIGLVLIVGAVLLLGGNLAHPVDAAPDHLSRFAFAANAGWVGLHLVIAAGFLTVATGIVAVVAGAGRDGRISATAAAVAAITGGGTMAVVFAGLDGFGAAALARQWATADAAGRAVLEPAAIALEVVDTGLAGIGTLLFLGLCFVALGWHLRSRALPHWLAPLCGFVGVLGTVTGVALLVEGPTPTTLNMLLRPAAAGTTLAVLALGVVLRRTPEGGSD